MFHIFFNSRRSDLNLIIILKIEPKTIPSMIPAKKCVVKIAVNPAFKGIVSEKISSKAQKADETILVKKVAIAIAIIFLFLRNNLYIRYPRSD